MQCQISKCSLDLFLSFLRAAGQGRWNSPITGIVILLINRQSYHHSWNIKSTFLAFTGSSKTFKHVKMFPMRRSVDLYCCPLPVPTPHDWREREYCQFAKISVLHSLPSLPLSPIFIQVEIRRFAELAPQWHFIGYSARQPSSRIITRGRPIHDSWRWLSITALHPWDESRGLQPAYRENQNAGCRLLVRMQLVCQDHTSLEDLSPHEWDTARVMWQFSCLTVLQSHWG